MRVRAPLAQDLRGRDDYKAAVNAARDIARDSVAVLTLLKLDRHRLTSTKRQSFGLALDVASVREDYWVTTGRGRMLSIGGAWHGSVGSWDFGNPDIRHYRLDPRFRYLNQALRTPDAGRTEWQRRILSGLRTYVTANSGHRPAMRIILAATALEALIGNEFAPGTGATGGHQMARRAAFVWCGAEFGDRHGSQRPICPFLAELNGKRLDQKLRDEAARGVPWTCSYYADLRDLYDDQRGSPRS